MAMHVISGTDDASYENISNIIKSHVDIINSSINKDIVVLLGKTGAGKSTLVNFLAGKELKVDTHDNIVLKNTHDDSAMKIGVTASSETILPKFINTDDLLLYDLPGFGETRGTALSLVEACFIKNIIENARAVRFVFVAGQDDITSERGKSFKELIEIIKKIVPTESIENISLLVITKTKPGKNTPQIISMLEEKTDEEVLKPWITDNRIIKMSAPNDDLINIEDKILILQAIKNLAAKAVKSIDTSSIYDSKEEKKISEIYRREFELIAAKLVSINLNSSALASLDITRLQSIKSYFLNSYKNNIIEEFNKTPLVSLLRTLAENMYVNTVQNESLVISTKAQEIAAHIESRIQELLRIKAEQERLIAEQRRKVAEEEARREQLRLKAEQDRLREELRQKAIAEQARLEQQRREVERRRIEAEQNDPKNWPVSREQKIERSSHWRIKLGTREWYNTGGMFGRNKQRWPKINCEVLRTITYERIFVQKPGTNITANHSAWQKISETEQETGNVAHVGYEY